MLGAAIGAIASGRVPVGNAAGNLVTSWVNPTSILAGCLAVAVGAFLAAVYLAADAARLGDVERYGTRSGPAHSPPGWSTGALAIAGLVVIHHDARHIYHGLTTGYGLAAVIVSASAGVATLALVWLSRFELARLSAALAVAAVLQAGLPRNARPCCQGSPFTKPRRTRHPHRADHLRRARRTDPRAVPRPAIPARSSSASSILAPSNPHRHHSTVRSTPGPPGTPRAWPVSVLLAGLVLLNLLDNAAAHVFGVLALLAAAVLAFAAAAPDDLLDSQTQPPKFPVR